MSFVSLRLVAGCFCCLAPLFAESGQTVIRLTGNVAAERFLNIVTPPLSGNRRAMAPRNLGNGPSYTPASALGSNSDATTNAVAAGNRFGGTVLKQLNTSPGVSSGASANNGMGSTAGSLSSTAGRNDSGGGGDFQLQLVQLVPAGKRVKQGEIIAEFDRTNQLNRLDDYKASVVQYDASIEKLKADQRVARVAHDKLIASSMADLEKAKLDLQTAEVRSAIDGEKLKLAVEEADARYKQVIQEVSLFDESQRAQLRSAEISRELSKIELSRVQRNISRMVVAAPMDGIAVMKDIFRGGEYGQIQNGDQLYPGQPFLQVIDPKSMIVNATVNQVDAEKIRLGQQAKVHLDAYPGVEFPAHVTGIGAMTKPGLFRPQFMREVPVRLKIDASDPVLIPDISASADIVIEESTKQKETVR